jgi:hypothetical protein
MFVTWGSDMVEIKVENAVKGVDYGKKRPPVTCDGPGCKNEFPARPGKHYCSARCRARAGDVRRLGRILDALRAGSLSDSDIRTLSRMVGRQGVKFRNQKPLRMNGSHRRVLTHLNALGDRVFVPELDPLFPSAARRCRELRAAGVLERVQSGRYSGYVRRTCPTCGGVLEYRENLDPAFPGFVTCRNDHPQGER